jgi:hypothetical protein
MDGRLFDDLVHALAAGRTARRGVLRLLFGGAAAGPLLLERRGVTEAKHKKKHKKKHNHGGGCQFATACDCVRWPIGDPVPTVLEWCRIDIRTQAECEALCPTPAGYLSINEFLVTRPELGLTPVCALNNDAQFKAC